MNYTLTIDKLKLQLLSTEESFDYKYILATYPMVGNAHIVSASIRLVKSSELEKNYLHTFALWVDEHRIATLSTDCRIKGQQGVKLAFDNEVFYTQPGWYHYLGIIEEQLPLSVRSISSFEIAFDFQSYKRLMPLLCWVYQYSSFLKHNADVRYAPLNPRLQCSLNFGREYVFGKGITTSGSSGKQVAAYCKTDELAERKHKPYILRYFEFNGLDMTQTIERIEVRLNAKWFGKYFVTVEGLNNPETMGDIFRQAVDDTFTFRRIGEHTFDKNRNKKSVLETLIDFPLELSNEPLYPRPVYASDNTSDTRNRSEAKNIVWRFIAYGNSQDWAQLQHFKATVKPPKGSEWPCLFKRYAQEYVGRPSDTVLVRICIFK